MGIIIRFQQEGDGQVVAGILGLHGRYAHCEKDRD